MRRGGDSAAFVAVLLLVMTGCTLGVSPEPSPPTIQAVGVATDIRFYPGYVRIAFADGTVHEVPAGYRQVGDSPSFNVVIIGSDSTGPFVASFPTQAGLPPDCFRKHAVGIRQLPTTYGASAAADCARG